MKKLFIILVLLSNFANAASDYSSDLTDSTPPFDDSRVDNDITIGTDGTIQGTINGSSRTFMNSTSLEAGNTAFDFIDGDISTSGAPLNFSSDSTIALRICLEGTTTSGVCQVIFSSVAPGETQADPPNVLLVTGNGDFDYAGTGNQITMIKVTNDISSSTQSGRVRGVDSLLKFSGDATQSGSSGNAARAFNSSVAWNSTSQATELVGNNATILAGGGTGVSSGTISLGKGFHAGCGYNTNDGGNISKCVGYFVATPSSVDATHTITTLYGIEIEDMEGTGITTGRAIKTGTGLVELGDIIRLSAGGEPGIG